MNRLASIIALFSFAVLSPVAPAVAGGVNNVFYGDVVHVSTQNIKVHNPKSGETLSFLIVPHFTKLLKSGGKVTAQQNEIHNGTFVEVVYDQKALGARHADQIILSTRPNSPIKS
jgi:hypothetical protein